MWTISLQNIVLLREPQETLLRIFELFFCCLIEINDDVVDVTGTR